MTPSAWWEAFLAGAAVGAVVVNLLILWVERPRSRPVTKWSRRFWVAEMDDPDRHTTDRAR